MMIITMDFRGREGVFVMFISWRGLCFESSIYGFNCPLKRSFKIFAAFCCFEGNFDFRMAYL